MDLPHIPPTVPGVVDIPSVLFPPPAAVTELEARLKFVDDLSLAECVRLDTQLQQDSNGLCLPPAQSLLQKRLDDVATSAQLHDMKLNLSKTKIIPFNFTRKHEFIPQFVIDGEPIEVVNQTKLLGLIVTSDCKWEANTKNIVTKWNGRLWFLRRLKTLGASLDTLLDIYSPLCR